jgi:hypothetical protein
VGVPSRASVPHNPETTERSVTHYGSILNPCPGFARIDTRPTLVCRRTCPPRKSELRTQWRWRHRICEWGAMHSSEGQRMTRYRSATAVFVLSLALSSSAIAEQQGGGVPAQSFTALQPLLIPGERLIIRDTSGKKTSGRFVSLSGDELVLARRRWNFRKEQRTWTEGIIREIQHKDSTWNGNVIGGAVGVIAVVAMAKSPQCDFECLPFAAAAVPVGMLIGDVIDGSRNRTVYKSQIRRVTAAPLIGRRQAGVALSYAFPP